MKNHDYWGNPVHPQAIPYGERFCCGVEHEVENIATSNTLVETLKGILSFHIDEDFSLVNGREIITAPAGLREQIAFHEAFHEKAMFVGPRFSDRTSAHVHVNVSFLTKEQTLALLKMYCLLEPYFFAFVGTDRQQNINCVPLWSTSMPKYLFNVPYEYLPEKWHKYTALNILPMTTIGTIEFRHLYGTQDNKTFANWLGMIKSLYDWVLEDGGRFNETLETLLASGYTELEKYLDTLNCPLGRFISLLKPHANAERCYDVYLLLTTEVFGGLSNWKKYVKDNV